MRQVLLIDGDCEASAVVEAALAREKLQVLTARQGDHGLELVRSRDVNLVICELQLADMSGFDALREITRSRRHTPVAIVARCATVRDAVCAMQMGAADFFSKPLTEIDLHIMAGIAAGRERCVAAAPCLHEAHAASRWARAVAPLAYATRDPRTTDAWSREVYASPGALRNWCRTAGVSTRRSLMLGRLLRAVRLGRDLGERPENVLDIVDLRTLSRVLQAAGLRLGAEWPDSIQEFLDTQQFIADPLLLRELAAALLLGPPQAAANRTLAPRAALGKL